MRVVYLLTRRGTLHKATQIDGGDLMTSEGDNADQMKGAVLYQDEAVARLETRRECKRCFRG